SPQIIPANRGFLRQTETTTTTTTVSQVVEETSTSTITKRQRQNGDDSAAAIKSRGGKFDDQVLAALNYRTPKFSTSAATTTMRGESPTTTPVKSPTTTMVKSLMATTVKSPKKNDGRQNVDDVDRKMEKSSSSSSSSPVKLPRNFFDKYKDEIEEMRKSRVNLNTVADDDDKIYPTSTQASVLSRVPSYGQNHIPIATVRPSSFSQSQANGDQPLYTKLQISEKTKYTTPTQNGDKKTVQISEQKFDAIRYDRHDDSFDSTSHKMNSSYDSAESGDHRKIDGWTVSNVPASWNMPGMRRSVVIEVGDAFLDDEG
uniref:Sciellin n=1 Tax=Romanomermis culicivorax TaxID=13658 RepID=A0A915JUT1_ROMCU